MNDELLPFEKPTTEKKEEKKGLAVTEKGTVALWTLEDQLSYAATLIKNGMVSSSFQTASQVVIAFQMAKALDFPEILFLRLVYVVNNRPCLYAEGPLSLCQRSPLWSGMSEFFIDKDGETISSANKNLHKPVYGSVTRVQRRNDEQTQEDYFTLDDLKTAGLDIGKHGKKDVWVKWQRIMMRYKARSIALKSKFADCLAGVPISEYDFNFSPNFPQIKPTPDTSVADELNAEYLVSNEAVENKEPESTGGDKKAALRDLRK